MLNDQDISLLLEQKNKELNIADDFRIFIDFNRLPIDDRCYI